MIKSCKSIWNNVSDIGCHPELDFEEIRRIRLMNRLNFISFFVLIVYIIAELFLKVYVFIPGLILMLLLVTCSFIFLYYRKYKTAKNFAVIVISLCIAFFVLTTGEALSEALFIPLSVMPLIIFRNKKISVFYLFYIISLTIILKIIQPGFHPLVELSGNELLFFKILNLLNGIIITYFITYYFKAANVSYESQLIHMNELVIEKNKEITDSINYAKRIQNAILPSPALFKNNFNRSFILFKPKDIVAGDFYWMHVSSNTGIYYFAAADCTGHGVPGAMVSVICSNALNRAVKEFNISDPGKILDKTRELVISTFVNEEINFLENSESKVKDGMDISLCCLNKKTNELLWSGANNPLWIIRENKLLEYKPDKQPIGHSDVFHPFTTQTIRLQNNDCIYIFTDGYADQFGGVKGKKFKYSQLKELLLKINDKDISERKKIIDNVIESWRGELEQVDDILVMNICI